MSNQDLPPPVAQYLDGVGTFFEEDLSCSDIGEGLGGWQGDFAARTVVQDYRGALVSVDSGVANAEIIQAAVLTVNTERDLVAGFLETGNVARS